MKNKKLWGKVIAVALCSAVLFTSTVSYAAEQQEQIQEEQTETEEKVEAKETVDTETQTETDVMPTVEEKTIEFEAGKTVEIPVTLGSGQYKADKVHVGEYYDETGKVAELGRGSDYNAEKGVIELKMAEDSFGTTIQKGIYSLNIQFEKQGALICKNNGVKVNVKETHQGFESHFDWYFFDGTKDIVFKFKNAEGDFAIKTIDRVLIEANEFQLEEDMIGSFKIDNSSRQGYTYDLEKGELIVKADAINQIFRESGFTKVSKEWNYGFDFDCTLANGEKTTASFASSTYLGEINFTNYKYDLVNDDPSTPEKPVTSVPKLEVTLPAGNTSITKDVMQSYVEKNKTHDVIIKTPNGVTFTFLRNSMSLVDGKEAYDFGTELITDYVQAGNAAFSNFSQDDFAFRINYNYSGQLPGSAKISIPLGEDSKWIGKTLYYYEIFEDGTSRYLTEATVDAHGIFTIRQRHCSDYVATSAAPQTPNEKAQNSDVPKTGDTSSALPYMMLSLGMCGVLVLRRKFI